MVPERLKPLLSRLKNPPANDDESLEAVLKRGISGTAITLIEKGISVNLANKLNHLEKLEEFVLRAAFIIKGTMTKSERQAEKEVYLKNKIDNFIEELQSLDEVERSILSGAIPYNGPLAIKTREINTYKEIQRSKNALYKWMHKHLSQASSRKRPDVIDMLTRLYEEYLPNVNVSFIDKQIIRMLRPFGIEYKERSIETRKRRDLSK